MDEITARLEARNRLTPEEIWNINREISFLDINVRALLPFLLGSAGGLPADDLRAPLIALASRDAGCRAIFSFDRQAVARAGMTMVPTLA
ncbi:hypothetical protein [Paracoccus sp. (in: a-proteobacteria)]|uniref:hypothetical protein n=1 Tax=Paracoccus sp. TaxID=267 RepID=UPI0035B4B87D